MKVSNHWTSGAKIALGLALLVAGLAGAANAPVEASPPVNVAEIPQNHIVHENGPDGPGIEYAVSLGLPKVAPSSDRQQFLYLPHPVGGALELELYAPELSYRRLAGAVPCSIPSESLPVASTRDREQADQRGARVIASVDLEKKARALCDESIHTFSKRGAEPLELLSMRARWEDYDGLPHATGVYAPPKNPAIFASTLPVKNLPPALVESESLKIAEGKTKKLTRPTLPAGLQNTKLTYYRYPGTDGESYVVDVTGEGGLKSELGEAKWGVWRAYYFVRGKNAVLLQDPREEGDLRFIGLIDLTGDGSPDLLFGDPVQLVLERAEDGFRSWHFAERLR